MKKNKPQGEHRGAVDKNLMIIRLLFYLYLAMSVRQRRRDLTQVRI